MGNPSDGLKRLKGMTRLELLVSLVIMAALGSISIPVISKTDCGNAQTKALNNAKGIYLALKMDAGDHKGNFPGSDASGSTPANANEVFRELVPQYAPAEEMFYVKGSAWTPHPPDEDTTKGRVLTAGENQFAFVPHLSNHSRPELPLIADGFKENEPGVYTSDEKAKGGAWKGKNAVVVRVDGSGKFEKLNPRNFKVYAPTTSTTPADIFAPAPNWLDANQRPLNPE